MIFLLKRQKDNGLKEISFTDLIKKLNLATLKKSLDGLARQVGEFAKRPEIDKSFILDEIGMEFLRKGEIMNLSNAASIEKIKTVKDGVIYYNKAKDAFRVKTKIGWKSIVVE